MTKSAKTTKKIADKSGGQRPVLQFRVHADRYEDIRRAAELRKLTISEEASRRLEEHATTLQDRDAILSEARNHLAQAAAITKSNVAGRMREYGYQPISTSKGKVWAEPGMDISHLEFVLPPAVEEAIEQAVLRALAKVKS